MKEKIVKDLVQKLKERKLTLVLAESCTAGLVSSLIAEVPGASSVLWGSFVCYTPQAKVAMLGLDEKALEKQGLVSEATARQMAEAALKKSGADLAVSVTGLAGPDGDGSDVLVGTVWVAAACSGGSEKTIAKSFYFSGGRNEVRLQAAIAVLEMVGLLDIMTNNSFSL